MMLAPALTKSGMMRSTGLTIRCTSIGAVVHGRMRLADQRADGQVGHIMVVHHVEVDPVGAGGDDVGHFLAQPGEIGGQNARCDDVIFG